MALKAEDRGRRCGNNGNTAKNSFWMHKEMQKRYRKGKGSIKEEADTAAREKEVDRERERDTENRRTYYVKGYIVGNGSEVMLIQSEVATELAGFQGREWERACSGREERSKETGRRRERGNSGGPIGRKT